MVMGSSTVVLWGNSLLSSPLPACSGTPVGKLRTRSAVAPRALAQTGANAPCLRGGPECTTTVAPAPAGRGGGSWQHREAVFTSLNPMSPPLFEFPETLLSLPEPAPRGPEKTQQKS
jgi:hypothetical protein